MPYPYQPPVDPTIAPIVRAAVDGLVAALADEVSRRVLERTPIATAPAADSAEYLTTNEAAQRLRMAPQTLRIWACSESGPIRPTRVGGRLRWSVADIDAVLAGKSARP